MTPLVCNGWTIYFHPLFNKQFQQLVSEVENLSSKLSKDKYVTHSSVKRLRALLEGIKNKIPSDPFASHFALQKPVEKYCRLKKMGLHECYRLFFRASREKKPLLFSGWGILAKRVIRVTVIRSSKKWYIVEAFLKV